MGLFASNIQIQIPTALKNPQQMLIGMYEELLQGKDDFERTDDVATADYFISVSPLRATGWVSLVCSETSALDLDGCIDLSRRISHFTRTTVVINSIFDSDDAITIVLHNGEVAKAFSNKKKNIVNFPADEVKASGGEPFPELAAIYRKREPFKERLVERTAEYFHDESPYWLINAPVADSVLTAYRLKNYVAKFAESTSCPRIVWTESDMPARENITNAPVREGFANIGGAFIGISIRLRDIDGSSNVKELLDPTIKDPTGKIHFPTSIVRTAQEIEIQFESVMVLGGVYELAPDHATFKYPSVFALDYQEWGVVLGANGKPIGKTQVTGKKYDFSVRMHLVQPSTSTCITIAPFHSDVAAALSYVIGKPIGSRNRSTGEVMLEIEKGKIPGT